MQVLLVKQLNVTGRCAVNMSTAVGASQSSRYFELTG